MYKKLMCRDIPELDGSVRSISSGTYAITSKADLLRLSDMGSIDGGTFILGADIDMAGESIQRGLLFDESLNTTFDGNGHTISNLNGGLFGNVKNSTIKNLGLINTNITGGSSPLVLMGENLMVSNCYADGGSIRGESYFFGGLVAAMNGEMEYCWSDIDIDASAWFACGGLIGAGIYTNYDRTLADVDISNSFSKGKVKNNCEYGSYLCVAGGIMGGISGSITNCYASGEVVSALDRAAGLSFTPQAYADIIGEDVSGLNLTINNSLYTGSSNVPAVQGEYAKNPATSSFTFQVGITGDNNSQIAIDKGFNINININVSTSEGARSALGKIDDLLSQVSEKQTQLGSAYNRLESALDSIGVSIDNLTSSRSTLRDADIAQVSSEYIRQQILQQASATLLATANQTPSIALHLI